MIMMMTIISYSVSYDNNDGADYDDDDNDYDDNNNDDNDGDELF